MNILFIECLTFLTENTNKVYIVGDLNKSELFKPLTEHINSLFKDFFYEYSLLQLVKEPTSKKKDSILDVFLTNVPTSVKTLKVCEPLGNSDHCSIHVKFQNKPINQPLNEVVFNYKKANYEAIKAELSKIDWHAFFSDTTDIETAYLKYSSLLKDLISAHVPIRKYYSKKTKKYSKNIQKLCTKKKKIWKKIIHVKKVLPIHTPKLETLMKKYDQLRTEWANEISNQEKNTALEIIKSNCVSNLFKYANSKLNSGSAVATLINSKGNLCTSNLDKANALNDQFKQVFTDDDGTLPNFKATTFHMPEPNFQPANIAKIMSNLSNSYSICPDGIPTAFYRNLSESLAEPLNYIFRLSWTTGLLPMEWKTAFVTPIPKKPNSDNPSDYRPISLTSTPIRIMEKIIKQTLVETMYSNSFLSNQQHGFRSDKSTISQLLECTYDWTYAMETKKFVDVVYIDFAKAFDTVSHEKLLYKLQSITDNKRLFNWTKNYLLKRSQKVNVQGTFSDTASVLSGVPQGSVLGPILFLIYINDIADEIEKDVNIKLFADDCKLYIIFEKLNENLTLTKMHSTLQTLSTWVLKWQMQLNVLKCAVLHIGKNNPKNAYFLLDQELAHVDSYKDLGIIMESDLKFQKHLNSIVSKAYQRLNTIFLAFKGLPPDIIKWAYCVYVRPILEYASSVWSPFNLNATNRLEKIQAYMTRRALGYNTTEKRPSYGERLKRLKMTTLEERRIKADLIFIAKILNGTVNTSLIDKLEIIKNNNRGHPYRYRVLNENHKNPKLSLFKNFLLNRTVNVWNCLPSSVFETSDNEFNTINVTVFKNAIRKLDLGKYCKTNIL